MNEGSYLKCRLTPYNQKGRRITIGASNYKNADNLEKSEDISTSAVSGFSDLENQEKIHKTVPVVKKDGEAKQTKGDNPESPHHF